MLAAGYVVLAGSIYVCESLGAVLGVRGLGVAGLAADIVILSGAVVLLGRRGSRLAGTLGPLLALCVVVLFFALADWTAAWLRRFGSSGNGSAPACEPSSRP